MSDRQTLELSVVIPVYNALPYLHECIDAIISQGLDASRYEVILVDDGSTDGSGEVCDALANRHDNLRVIHQANSGGGSKPRNVGIEAARGDYVFFCDADDTLMPRSLNDMLWHAKTLKSDLCCFKIKTDWGSTYNGLFEHERRACTIDDDPILDFFGSYKLHSRDLIVQNGIRFIEGIIPEDWAFGLECYLNAKNVCVVCDHEYYHYRKRTDGTSLTLSNLTAQAKDWDAKVRAFEAYYACAERYVDIDEHPRLTLRLCRWLSASFYGTSSDALTVDSAKALSELLSRHYTEDVRSLCPFTVLLACDALVAGHDVERLGLVARSVRGEGTIEFDRVSDEEASYVVRSASGEKILSSKMPSPLGEELSAPKFSSVRLDGCNATTSSLRLEGSSSCLVDKEFAASSDLLLFADREDGSGSLGLPVELVERIVTPAYVNVSLVKTKWRAEVRADDLVFLHDEKTCEPSGMPKLDLYLGTLRPDGGHVKNRLGSVRSDDCVMDRWLNSVTSTRWGFVPLLTGAGNLSLRPFARDTSISASRQCKVTSAARKGESLELAGTLVCPKSPGISAVLDIRTRDARESKLATAKVTLTWQDDDDATCRWTAKLPAKTAASVILFSSSGVLRGSVAKMATVFPKHSTSAHDNAPANPLRTRMVLTQNGLCKSLETSGLYLKRLLSALGGRGH